MKASSARRRCVAAVVLVLVGSIVWPITALLLAMQGAACHVEGLRISDPTIDGSDLRAPELRLELNGTISLPTDPLSRVEVSNLSCDLLPGSSGSDVLASISLTGPIVVARATNPLTGAMSLTIDNVGAFQHGALTLVQPHAVIRAECTAHLMISFVHAFPPVRSSTAFTRLFDLGNEHAMRAAAERDWLLDTAALRELIENTTLPSTGASVSALGWNMSVDAGRLAVQSPPLPFGRALSIARLQTSNDLHGSTTLEIGLTRPTWLSVTAASGTLRSLVRRPLRPNLRPPAEWRHAPTATSARALRNRAPLKAPAIESAD